MFSLTRNGSSKTALPSKTLFNMLGSFGENSPKPRLDHSPLDLPGLVDIVPGSSLEYPQSNRTYQSVIVGVWIKAKDSGSAGVSEKCSAAAKKFHGIGKLVKCIHADNQVE